MPLELEDGEPPRVIARTLYILCALVIGLLLWASIGQIREVAPTRGEIVPAGEVRSVQHLEGGIVEAILVREGDRVEAGAPLVRLTASDASSELARIRVRLDWLALEDARLDAEARGEARLPEALRGSVDQIDLSDRQRESFIANLRARKKEQEALAARVAQRRAEVASLAEREGVLLQQVETEREKFQIQTELLKEGYTSRRRYLDAKTQMHSAENDLAGVKGQLAQARAGLSEAEAALAKARADVLQQVAEQKSKIAEERAELREQIVAFEDRADRLVVRAPTGGFVKHLEQTGAGAVVRPGDLVAEIVPQEEDLVAEVKVEPKDIGHIRAGDAADVVLTSYDQSRYGTVAGTVRTISASSFKDENGEAYFKAIIALAAREVGEGANRRPVLPGMVVQANVVTGSKSLMRYILKPIFRSLDTAFGER
ncbi:HlyD family type I secretion periplasmic adaptor subunit [Stappia sp.]|uniref:HlyD family type I secretion periplasmic adaptor subunit n=1 Tax=Stappia sp. TaxID=1870903 RepID=UPI0032D9A570